jgi:hypothetical protein
MDFWVAVVALTGIGCGTGMVCMFIDKVFGNRNKGKLEAAQRELRLAAEQARQQELRIGELSRQNEQLQKQVEWHNKLLESQDQLLKRLGTGNGAAPQPLPEETSHPAGVR